MVGQDTVWEEVLRRLRTELRRFHYDTFFGNSEPLLERNGIYYFVVHNLNEKKLMEKKYRERTIDLLREVREELKLPTDNLYVEYLTPEEADHFQAPAVKRPSVKKAGSPKQAARASRTVSETKTLALNPNHTFDSFVVGDSNEFAHAAAVAVAGRPGEVYNPLFLYGGAGLGKTHLMHAIGNELTQTHPELNIVYVTSETFTHELISMIRTGGSTENRQEFRDKYRTADVLMIDDIQFIAGKETTQDEFFHTFNALHGDGKQIILSSDRPPSELTQLEARMRTRFEWGLLADIHVPDYETRVAILMRKASEDAMMLPTDDEVFGYMAQQPNEDIRSLESALRRVSAYARLHNADRIDRPIAEAALREIYHSAAHKTVSAKLVCDVVSEYYDVTKEELLGPRRTKDIAFSRQVAMYILRQMTDMSLNKIAGHFGKKDHTTVMHAEKTISDAMRNNPDVKKDVEDLMAKLRNA